MVSKDLEEIELLKPKQSSPKKFIGIIFSLIALMFFLLSLVCFISIFGFFVGVGFIAIAICFAVAGSKLYSGDKKIKCPYCDDELTVSPEQKSIKCGRCHKIILLKWLDNIVDKEAKLENNENNSKILKDKHIYENTKPIDGTKGKSSICWFFGIYFLLAGLAFIAEGNYALSIFMFIISAIILPNTNKIISEKCGFELTGKRRIILIIILFTLAALFTPTEYNDSNNSDNITPHSTEQLDKQKDMQSARQLDQKEAETLITKSTRDMLPTGEDIPTEYYLGKIETGYTNAISESYHINIDKNEGTTGLIDITFTVTKYNSIENARSGYNTRVNGVKEERGYTELKSKVNADCFAYKIDEGFYARFAENICITENVVFSTYVTTSNTFRTPEKYLNEMAQIFEKRIG